ncbi:MAG: nucleotidyl transferase AbiEii/AbiGii toxin family protein [Deltaproteobacteria bacterium]|nr:nucleotidyl transferase AbiEii/AbiGii toxin family protein [Deltaproteobacteria bacterium]
MKLWPLLGGVPERFVLYGGTAIALRLGHRKSIDFDFFTSSDFTTDQLMREMTFLANGRRIQESANTLTMLIAKPDFDRPVKLSFFGGLRLRQIHMPDQATNGLLIASLKDLLGMKCAVVSQRAEAKDYLDIHAIITKTKLTLSHGLAAARAIYGSQYNGVLTLKALCFFQDGNVMTLPDEVKGDLTQKVKACDLAPVPEIVPEGTIGEAGHRA